MQEEKFGVSTKRFMIEELKGKFSDSPDFIITNYRGLKSPEIEKLRKQLIKASSKYFVVKNSIIKRVFDQLDLKDLNQFIKDEVGIGFVGDVVGASKVVVDFSKGHSSLKLNAAFIDGKIEDIDRIKHLAALPPKEVLLAMTLTCMKSPITGFVGVLKNLLRNLVHALNEIKNAKAQNKE